MGVFSERIYKQSDPTVMNQLCCSNQTNLAGRFTDQTDAEAFSVPDRLGSILRSRSACLLASRPRQGGGGGALAIQECFPGEPTFPRTLEFGCEFHVAPVVELASALVRL